MSLSIMLRQRKRVTIEKLPDKAESDQIFRLAMEDAAKEFARAILATNKLHGPLTSTWKERPDLEKQAQMQLVSWAYDVRLIG